MKLEHRRSPGGAGRRRLVAAAAGLILVLCTQVATSTPANANRTYTHGTVDVAANQDGRLEVFATDANDRLWHRRQVAFGENTDTNWSAWMQIPGSLRSVAAETNADGRIEVFGVGPNGDIWHSIQQGMNSEDWSSWMPISGNLSSIAVARNADGRMELFGTNHQDQVWHRRQLAVGSHEFGSWELFNGLLRGVAAETNAQGRIELFGFNGDGQIWSRLQDGANRPGWGIWTSIPGLLASIAVAAGGNGRLQLFGTNAANSMFRTSEIQPGSDTWTGWEPFGDGGTTRNVAAGANGDGQVWAMSIYFGYMLQKPQRPDGSWEYWTLISRAMPQFERPSFYIHHALSNAQKVSLLLQGVGTPEAVVRIAPGVQIDLSWLEGIDIARGVTMIGERTSAHPYGPRLFTTTYPYRLFNIGSGTIYTADYVRITGIRLDGGLNGREAESEEPDSDGITITSSLGVQIDNSDIYGWRGAAIRVDDEQARIHRNSRDMPVISNNYLHHNQHQTGDVIGGGHGAGYGVSVRQGAYAQILRNAFDFNRHAIAGDGRPGSGYFVLNNYIADTGGTNTPLYHTHQIDMHGRDCEAQCGRAGDFMEIAYNTIHYDSGTAIKLRGTPAASDGGPAGMFVHHNVFQHSRLWTWLVLFDGALDQTETGLTEYSNRLGYEPNWSKRCDFDGDGTAEILEASGVDWWIIENSLDRHPRHLRSTSYTNAHITALRDANNDGRCDVIVGSTIYYTPPLF
jgi:Tectonin domain